MNHIQLYNVTKKQKDEYKLQSLCISLKTIPQLSVFTVSFLAKTEDLDRTAVSEPASLNYNYNVICFFVS